MTNPSASSNAISSSLTVFIAYSRQDDVLRSRLDVHLANLRRQGKIDVWHDRAIEAGIEWEQETQQQLDSATIILLLISPDFMNSDVCYGDQMQAALTRHEEGTARVIPIILRPTDTPDTPFSKLTPLPKDAKPITTWTNQDEAYLNVVQGIRQAIDSFQPSSLPTSSPPTPPPPQASSSHTPPSSSTPPSPPLPTPHPFTPSIYKPTTWVERADITKTLLDVLWGNCRILALVGITGIDKTALAERLVAELTNTPVEAHSRAPRTPVPQQETKPFRRLNLDDGSITPDFASSGAALLRSLGDEPTLEDQKDPQNLLNHVLIVLTTRPFRLQIDSMERLLRGNDQEGWSEFCDPLWLHLFQHILTANNCQSQIILTTQDIPENLAYEGSRYDALWHCKPMRGLSEAEQLELFQKRGIDVGSSITSTNTPVGTHGDVPSASNQVLNANSAWGRQPSAPTPDSSASSKQDESLDYLKRIGRIYDGHPLVLRVIAEDIKTCGGDVVRYWQQCHFDDLEANRPIHFSRRKLQRDVERRVKTALESLPTDALQILCRASVYRRPVPRDFWLGLMSDLDPDQGDTLLDLLESRGFATEDWEPGAWLGADGDIPLRQHNLIRNVAYSLLQANKPICETAHRQAADRWLNLYEPIDNVPNLEKVRGLIEAFHHYCNLEEWQAAKTILLDRSLGLQLQTWGQYQEMVRLHSSLIPNLQGTDRVSCTRGLGNAFFYLSQYQQAIAQYQQSLDLAQEIGDRSGEGKALGNLGLAYDNLGQYQQAIDSHQQYLAIAREIGDRSGEGKALSGLGLAYKNLGQYQQAIDFHQQHLAIAREIGDRRGEAIALGNLGDAYCALENYSEAIDLQNQKFQIACEIGGRDTESYALEGLGEALIKLERFDDALASLQQALDICEQTGNRSLHAKVLKNLAELHQKLGEQDRALAYCEQALAISTELGIPLANDCTELLQSIASESSAQETNP